MLFCISKITSDSELVEYAELFIEQAEIKLDRTEFVQLQLHCILAYEVCTESTCMNN